MINTSYKALNLFTISCKIIIRPEISISPERARRARPPKFVRARQEKSVPGKKGSFTIFLTTHVFSEEIVTSEITTTFLILGLFDALL